MIIVARLVARTRQIEMLSIPRDTYVPIQGTGGSNRINSAFNTGPGQLVETIQQDFGIPINHVVVANFPGFEGMVNALGGISLDFPYPVRDLDSGLNVTTLGCQTVNGSTALALVRSRHLYYFKGGGWNYDGMSDWSRIQRQQAFFHAVVNKADSEFPNLLAMNSFLRATADDLQVDSGFSSREMISLGLRFRGVGSASLATEVLPTYGATVDGNDVLMTAQPYAQQMISSFLAIGSSTSTKAAGASGTSVPAWPQPRPRHPRARWSSTIPRTCPNPGTRRPADLRGTCVGAHPSHHSPGHKRCPPADRKPGDHCRQRQGPPNSRCFPPRGRRSARPAPGRGGRGQETAPSGAKAAAA